ARHLMPRPTNGDGDALRSFACGDGSQLVKRVADQLAEVALVGFVVPAFDRDPEGRDPDLGGAARVGLTDTPLSPRVGQHRRARKPPARACHGRPVATQNPGNSRDVRLRSPGIFACITDARRAAQKEAESTHREVFAKTLAR